MITEGNGASIWWETRGAGPPVLLLNGLTFASEAWFRVLPHLLPNYQVITMDNRGVGRSSAPKGRYTVTTMARDAAGVLDSAQVSRAHVVGISMGSCIAQELALIAPERVASLVLAASNPGSRHSKYPSAAAIWLLSTSWFRDYARFSRKLIPYTYHPATDRARIDEDRRIAHADQPNRRGLLGQTFGAAGWDRYDDLPGIDVPTLVLHGADDRLDPAINAETLANRIPNARLAVLPRASHEIFTDQEEAAVGAILDFLGALSE